MDGMDGMRNGTREWDGMGDRTRQGAREKDGMGRDKERRDKEKRDRTIQEKGRETSWAVETTYWRNLQVSRIDKTSGQGARRLMTG